jgi:hypothetical protein
MMTIIEALLFVLFAFVMAFLYIMLLGAATIAQQAEDKVKELEKKIEDLINTK